MNLDDAKMQASIWWGANGSADLRTGRRSQRFVVGATNLRAALGGYVAQQFGASWTSFEDAFEKAVLAGHGPVTGFEGDDALVDEA